MHDARDAAACRACRRRLLIDKEVGLPLLALQQGAVVADHNESTSVCACWIGIPIDVPYDSSVAAPDGMIFPVRREEWGRCRAAWWW